MFNESSGGQKKHVGKGRLVLRSVLPLPLADQQQQQQKQQALFTINLSHVSKKGETQKGVLTFNGTIAPITNEEESKKKEKRVNIRISRFEITNWTDSNAVVTIDCAEKTLSATSNSFQNDKNSLVWKQSDENKIIFPTMEGKIEDCIMKVIISSSDKVLLCKGEATFKSKNISFLTSKEEQSLSIPLNAVGDKKSSSILTIYFFLEEDDPFFSFKSGRLLVKRMACHDLKNVEMVGEDDPYIVLKLGSESRQTEAIEEGGSNVSFDLLDIAFDVQRETIEYDKLQVKVMDKNSLRSDVQIGECTLTLLPLLHRVNEVVEFRSDIKDAKSLACTGSVILFLQLMDQSAMPPDNELEIVAIDPNFKEGVLQINTVRAFDLKNPSALLDSSVHKPFLKFKFSSWSVKSSYINIAKSKVPIFENLGFSTEVTLDEVLNLTLEVEVDDAHLLTGGSRVGQGTCSLRAAAAKIGEESELHVDLSNGTAPCGRLVIYAKIVEKPAQIADNVDYEVPENFKEGIIFFKKIIVNNLKNTELIGQQVRRLDWIIL